MVDKAAAAAECAEEGIGNCAPVSRAFCDIYIGGGGGCCGDGAEGRDAYSRGFSRRCVMDGRYGVEARFLVFPSIPFCFINDPRHDRGQSQSMRYRERSIIL